MLNLPNIQIRLTAHILSGHVVIDPKFVTHVDLEPNYVAVRRATQTCSNNAKHGPSKKGGRCMACWERKRANDKKRDSEKQAAKVAARAA